MGNSGLVVLGKVLQQERGELQLRTEGLGFRGLGFRVYGLELRKWGQGCLNRGTGDGEAQRNDNPNYNTIWAPRGSSLG